jgi:hypothetical protein
LFSLKVIQYREYAREYRMFAAQTCDEMQKCQLLKWAEAWENKATERERRITGSHYRLHPG